MASPPVAHAPVRELTLRVIVLGILLSVIMGAANVYLGLKAGMTVSASIPAAVIAMLILRGLFKDGTILEANQVQTAASAGESLAAGIIFTMPALVIVGVWAEFDWLMTTVIGFAGGMLGILFMIPMRRVFVVGDDSPELKYPEAVACAAVLQSADDDEAQGDSARSILTGALIGAVIKLLSSFAGLIQSSVEGAWALGERVFYFGGDISPALVAVGFIVRLNVALLIFIGGSIGWLVAIPLMGGGGEGVALDTAWTIWSTKIRYVGVGAMVVGGIASIWHVRGGLVRAVEELRKASRSTGQVEALDTDTDMSGRVIIAWGVLAVGLVFAVYHTLMGNLGLAMVTTVIMVVMSFFFTAVASYIVGLVGNSNSPVSGMTITAVLFTGALLLLFGFTGEEGILAILGVAAIVCCAACTSGDVCNDLKTGAIVGASPRRQQMMQIIGVGVAALVMAPILTLLHDNTPGGIGGKELAAPQAALFASLASGFFGDGKLPWDMVTIGAGLGVVILAIDAWLGRIGSTFRLHIMPVAVGLYLPFSLAPPILLGGLMAHVFGAGTTGADADRRLHRGVLFSSGAIAGESLMGIGLALLVSFGVQNLDLGLAPQLLTTISLGAAATILALFWWGTRPRT